MAETPKTNDRIEELRSRLAGDPKSRLFFPLAEELRKVGAYDEAEGVLRSGLSVHGSYLSAWISLGRVLKELGRHDEGIEVLDRAMTLDPGNMVAARLLAESHLAAGNRVEAIKKYKLVRALHPADDELEDLIEQLSRDIQADSEAETERVPLEQESQQEAREEITPPRESGDDAESADLAQADAVPPVRSSTQVPEETKEAVPQAVEPGVVEGGVAEGETTESAGVVEEEPFGPSAVPVGGRSMGSDVGGERMEEALNRGPFEEGPVEEGPVEEGSPFEAGESTPMNAASSVISEGERAAEALPIPPTSADLVGRGRNRARIERLEHWLEKIRGE